MWNKLKVNNKDTRTTPENTEILFYPFSKLLLREISFCREIIALLNYFYGKLDIEKLNFVTAAFLSIPKFEKVVFQSGSFLLESIETGINKNESLAS